MNAEQFDRIDHYLRGELSATDAKEFEANLAADPALSEEFALQKNVVEGIRAYRKQQLKHQLSQVALPEHTGWQVAGIKGLVGAAVTSAVLVGAWYFNADTDNEDGSAMITMRGPAYMEKEILLPEIKSVEEVVFERADTEAITEKSVNTVFEAVEESSEAKEFRVDLLLPEDQVSASDSEFVPEQVTEEFRSSTIKPTSDALQVDNFDGQSTDLRYEYFDGKLALYGNFGDSPYQILEINQSGEKRLFLFHEDAYYAITNTSRPLPLEAIEDVGMIEELEIFKSEK